ncbi:MAG: NAD(P)H-dependent oxidoreductase [Lachnospiraceae bacterium]|nr:NAD(P)H-dependent oxidoreductase [Lachnospiraceae bacterium]
MKKTKVTVIRPFCDSPHERMDALLGEFLKRPEVSAEVWQRAEQLRPVRGGRIFFALELEDTGLNLEWCRMLARIRQDASFFRDSVGVVAVDGHSELYTKSVGRELVLTANLAGCLFPGRPLVEGTGSLHNFQVTAQNLGTDLWGAYQANFRELADRLLTFEPPRHEKPRVLVLHASIWETSNTLRLWQMVKEELEDIMEFREISLRNGEIYDCVGCPYTMCLHFSERGKCYYGGVMVEQVYPAVEECDALMMLCPNYNDALSANLCAFINRLTSLYRKRQFFEKYLYAIVVSGYSGGDILANQLISGLNMNKTFILPPNFVMMETTNAPGSIVHVGGIRERATAFAGAMRRQMLQKEETNS